jgi:hypothetical protein
LDTSTSSSRALLLRRGALVLTSTRRLPEALLLYAPVASEARLALLV